MADTSTSVSGPVTVKSDSAERVAYELFRYLQGGTPEQIDRALDLYARCVYHTKNPGQSVATVKRHLQTD